jgi:TIR domain
MPFMGLNWPVSARICLPVAWLGMSAAGGGGIFVSYRRAESSHVAGRLADRLIDRFGAEQVFIDVEAIEPGVDFAEAIFRAVDACVVLVAVIGPGWLLAADERGRRRLDDPDDLVRLEIGTALTRRVRLIPVLVEGAIMPRREDLPESLVGLGRRNALPIRHESFRDDAGRLVAAIEKVLASAAVAAVAEGVRSARDVSGVVVKEGSSTGLNDLARATRLFDNAERIANSLTSEYLKVLALSGIAKALAA